MPKNSSGSARLALERAILQLSGIERLLDSNDLSAGALTALDSDFELFRREYLDRFGDYEIVALGAQILDVELRLKELKAADHSGH